MPKVKFDTIAYVQCSKPILNYLKQSCPDWADGQENVCTTVDDLYSFLEEEVSHKAFFNSVLKQVSGKAGDIIFHL